MDVILGQTVTVDFTTHDPITGQVSDADFLPTAQVFENDNDIPIALPVVVRRAGVGMVGNYRVTFPVTTALGYELTKSYNVIVMATVNAVTAKARIADFIPADVVSVVVPAHVL